MNCPPVSPQLRLPGASSRPQCHSAPVSFPSVFGRLPRLPQPCPCPPAAAGPHPAAPPPHCGGVLQRQAPRERSWPEPDDAKPTDPVSALNAFEMRLDAGLLPIGPGPASPTHGLQRLRGASLEALFGALVQRAAWAMGPDRRSATLRLEIGAGALHGCAIIIDASPNGLQVVLDAPPGVDVENWRNRLSQRLASEGLAASIS